MRELKRKAIAAKANHSVKHVSLYRRLHEGCLIVMLATGFFVLLSLLTYHRADPSWSHQVDNVKILNAGGRVGAWLSDFLLYLFGYLTYFFPVIIFQGAWELYRNYQHLDEIPEIQWSPIISRAIGFLMTVISSTSLLHLYLSAFSYGLPYESGGIVGVTMGNLLLQWFNRMGATIVFIPVFIQGFKRREMLKVIFSFPAFFVLRFINAIFIMEAYWSEIILKKRLTQYEKGH